MADYFTHFSCALDTGDPEKALRAMDILARLRAEDEEADEPQFGGFDVVLQDGPSSAVLWIHDDDQGDVEGVIAFVLRLAEELDLSGLWGFTYRLCRIRHKEYYAGIKVMPHGSPADGKHQLAICS